MPISKKQLGELRAALLASAPKPKAQKKKKARSGSKQKKMNDSMTISRFDLVSQIKKNSSGAIQIDGKTFPSLNEYSKLFSDYDFVGQLVFTFVPSGGSNNSGTIYLAFGTMPDSELPNAATIATDRSKLARYRMVTANIRNKVSFPIKNNALEENPGNWYFGVVRGVLFWNTIGADSGGELWVRYTARCINPKA